MNEALEGYPIRYRVETAGSRCNLTVVPVKTRGVGPGGRYGLVRRTSSRSCR
jgi:hypothetical protein